MNKGNQPSAKHATIKSESVLLFENKSIDSQLLTIPEVAEFLRISVTGVRRLQQKRHLPFIKVGGNIRFAWTDITTYLAQQRVEPIE